MADTKAYPMHKRIAQGEKVSGMKKGGAVKKMPTSMSHKGMKKGGKTC